MSNPQPPERYQKTTKAPLGGGYGLVEIWHDRLLDREVAIKWTKPEDAAQLLSEVRALSQRPSPYIVEIYDVVMDHSGLRGIILEYLPGSGFESVQLTGEQEYPKAVALLYQMAQGLADLHGAGLVHRDVKPANAVCAADGRLKLVDFGLSSPVAGAFTSSARGTFGYAAPELFGKAPIAITAAMDVYSFGMVCWQTLTGGRPNVGPMNYPDSTYFPLPSILDRVVLPRGLAAAIDACLAWQPQQRPQMQSVADAFMAELTFSKHSACVLMAGRAPDDVTTDRKLVSKVDTPHGSISIGYNGYCFSVRKVEGAVYVNNVEARVDMILERGCLLTFGGPAEGANRRFIPFRQSAPEIVF